MRRAIWLLVPWTFLTTLAVALDLLLWPRIVWPSIGATAFAVIATVLIGPYVVAAITHSVDLARGRLPDESAAARRTADL